MPRFLRSVSPLQAVLTLPSQADAAAREKALRDLADLHGEMVLLIHWSMLNYAAVCKILKKHDKRTGLFLRAVGQATHGQLAP